MANKLVGPPRKAAFKLVRLQCFITAIASLIINFGWGATAAMSAVIGGLIAVLPSLVFAYYAFRFVGASSAKLVAASFYRGQSLKLLITFVLFIIAFKFMNVIVEPLMATFILTSMTHWLAPVYFNQR